MKNRILKGKGNPLSCPPHVPCVPSPAIMSPTQPGSCPKLFGGFQLSNLKPKTWHYSMLKVIVSGCGVCIQVPSY